MNLGDQQYPQAKNWIEKAIEADKKIGNGLSLAYNYITQSKLSARMGELEHARQNLGIAIEIYEKCGADGWVERYKDKLASL